MTRALERDDPGGQVAGEHDLEMIAAGLRRDAADTRLHGDVVLETLATSLPAELCRIDRAGGMFRKPKLTGVQVSLGDRRYVLKATPTGLVSSVCHESGGIVMSTTQVPFDAWISDLLSALSAMASRSTAATLALQQLAITGEAPPS